MKGYNIKKYKNRFAECRCAGFGPNYTPFITVQEAKSYGTAAMIPDPFEGRYIHCLSRAESDFYYTLRWNDDVAHIREQFLLDPDIISKVFADMGFGKMSNYFTTDFLVDFKDGSQTAFSIKGSKKEFDPDNPKYRGSKSQYAKLINRQAAEAEYWERQGVSFAIVTSDMLNMTFITNVKMLMSHYDTLLIRNTEQKLMWLLAHKFIQTDMTEKVINPRQLVEASKIDIDDFYDHVQEAINNERD